jgi:hypothetical protein
MDRRIAQDKIIGCELSFFVVRCLTDVNTKGNCLVGVSLAAGREKKENFADEVMAKVKG